MLGLSSFNQRVKKILSDPAFEKPISHLNKKSSAEISASLIITIKKQLQWQLN